MRKLDERPQARRGHTTSWTVDEILDRWMIRKKVWLLGWKQEPVKAFACCYYGRFACGLLAASTLRGTVELGTIRLDFPFRFRFPRCLLGSSASNRPNEMRQIRGQRSGMMRAGRSNVHW